MDVYRMAARRGTPTRRRALGTQVVTQSVRAVPPANHNATRLVPSGEPSMRSCVLNHAQRRAVGWGPPHSSERGLLAGPWRHIDVDRSRKSSEEMYDSFTQLHARAEPETTDVNANSINSKRNYNHMYNQHPLHSRQPGPLQETTRADRPPPHDPSASHPRSSPHSMIRTHVIQHTRSSCGSGALPASPPVKPPPARRPGRREPASRQRGRRARRMRLAAVAWAPPTLRLTSSCRRPATRPLACRSFGQRSRDG